MKKEKEVIVKSESYVVKVNGTVREKIDYLTNVGQFEHNECLYEKVGFKDIQCKIKQKTVEIEIFYFKDGKSKPNKDVFRYTRNNNYRLATFLEVLCLAEQFPHIPRSMDPEKGSLLVSGTKYQNDELAGLSISHHSTPGYIGIRAMDWLELWPTTAFALVKI